MNTSLKGFFENLESGKRTVDFDGVSGLPLPENSE